MLAIAPTSLADNVIFADNALPLIVLVVGTFPSKADLIILFCTGLAEDEESAESIIVLFAPASIPFNFSSKAVVNEAVVASKI